MRVLDPLARPRIVIEGELGEFAVRGLTHGLRSRLPLARIETVSSAGADRHASGVGADAVVRGASRSASVNPLADDAVELPAQDMADPAMLCTAAVQEDLRDRRIALMRRLDWLPHHPVALVADGSPTAMAALRDARAAGLDGEATVVVALGQRQTTPPIEASEAPAWWLPAEAGIDDIAAVVIEATVCVGVHPTLVALAAGCGLPMASDSAVVLAALRGEGTRGPASMHGGLAALDERLDRACRIALARWQSSDRPDDAARRGSARSGAAHATREVEAAHLTAQLAQTRVLLGEAQAELAAVHHSRTWRYRTAVGAVIARARAARSGPR